MTIGGYDIQGGGANAPFTYGVNPYNQSVIDQATATSEQGMENRYSQLGLGGPAAPAPAATPAPATASATGGLPGDALMALNSMLVPTGGGPYMAGAGTPAGVWGNTAASAAPAATAPASGPFISTAENQDLANIALAGQALTGQEQTANVGQPALNPALQPQYNRQVGGVGLGTLAQTAANLGKAVA